jgi:hypothetical protein
MNSRKKRLSVEQQELLDEMLRRSGEALANDIYMDGEPLTFERKRALGWPVTAEEALACMRENKRKQEASE